MDLLNTAVVLLDGKRLYLQERLEEVVQALNRDGCVLLKRATDLSPVEVFLSSDLNSLESVRKEIVLNEAVKAILFSARDGDFRITGYQAFKIGTQSGGMSRDKHWKEIAAEPKLVGANCIHLGGDGNVQWIIGVDNGSGKVAVEASGGDIFVCTHWLKRSSPRLLRQPPAEGTLIAVAYLWNGSSNRGRMVSGLGDKIIQVGGDSCSRTGEFVLWKHVRSSA